MYVIGNVVQAFCSKCNMLVAHSIGKLSGTRISQVECSTCKDNHAFRKSPPKSPGATQEARKAAAVQRGITAAAANFDTLMHEADMSKAMPYGFAATFHLNDIIDHKAFGLGRVIRTLSGNKIEVVFKQSSKILVHGGP